MINYTWCDAQELKFFCSYLTIKCGPHYIQREFSLVTFMAVYIQKPSIDGSIHAKLKLRTTAFNLGKVTGNTDVDKQTS